MALLTFDIETWGAEPGFALQPWRTRQNKAGILSVVCGSSAAKIKESNFNPTAHNIKEVMQYADPKTDILCGWNLKFDIAFLLNYGLEKFFSQFKMLDGMLLLKRLRFLESYGLKKVLTLYADNIDWDKYSIEYHSNYNESIDFKPRLPKDYSLDEQMDLILYNNRDVIYTQALIEYLAKTCSKRDLIAAICESTTSLLFASSWNSGLVINHDAVLPYQENLENVQKQLLTVFSKIGLTEAVINSPKQLQEFLRFQLKQQLTERTDKGAYSVNANVLNNLYHGATGSTKQLLRLLVKYKKIVTELSKFVTPATQMILSHAQPMMSGTYTGRLTYNGKHTWKEPQVLKNGKAREVKRETMIGLPIHQMKRGPIRNFIKAPDGYQIVELDFSGQEMRLLAAIANEQTMLTFFNEGKDLHAYTGAAIAKIDYVDFLELAKTDPEKYKQTRYVGKVTNLSLQYRLGASSLYRNWHDKYNLLDKTENDAYAARETYLQLYKGVEAYWSKAIEFARINGFATNLAGRRHYLNEWVGEKAYSSEQTAINFPIQSSGAEQKILALYILQRQYFCKYSNIKFGWDLHDGMYFFVPECDMMHDIIREMVEIVENLPYEAVWGWKPPLRFTVEAKVGKTWGSLKEI